MPARVELPREKLVAFCEQNGIRKLSLFGSVLRDDFRPESDIDVLVEFEPRVTIGLLDMARMERELSVILGRKVDLRTPEELSQYFRQHILQVAEVQYERTG